MATSRILIGDTRESMRSLPAGSVHCCVTSPPYFALRSYLPADHPSKELEIGSEPTPEEFIATMVEVFRDVRRVLRDDGVVFVNLGDSYNQYNAGQTASPGTPSGNTQHARQKRPEGLAASIAVGNLLNIPHRVAEALRADGWIWRQTIVWAKRSPMPESVSGWRWVRCRVKVAPCKAGGGNGNQRMLDDGEWQNRRMDSHLLATWSPCPGCPKCQANDGWVLRRGKGRCTTSHEYVFVFSKTDGYFWDSVASAEQAVGGSPGNKTHKGKEAYESGDEKHRTKVGLTQVGARKERNPRTVWLLSSEPTREKHFATFPSELARRCIVAGVSAGGCCPTCGSPWAPMVESDRVATRPGTDSKVNRVSVHPESPYNDHKGMICGNRDPERHATTTVCHGYRQTCRCEPHAAVPCTVLDCFSGMATTGQTALWLGHDYIGCELNPEYAAMSEKRLKEPPRWWLRLQQKPKSGKRRRKHAAQRELFD